MILKGHALVEAATIHAICGQFQQEGIKKHLRGLKQKTRLELLKDLNVFPEEMVSKLKLLGELRNKLAHKIESVNFTFKAYLDDIDNRNAFKSVFCTVSGNITLGDRTEPRSQFYFNNPQLAIVYSIIDTLSIAYSSAETINAIHEDIDGFLRKAIEVRASQMIESSRGK